jgi:hypothetical protein
MRKSLTRTWEAFHAERRGSPQVEAEKEREFGAMGDLDRRRVIMQFFSPDILNFVPQTKQGRYHRHGPRPESRFLGFANEGL